MHLLFPAPSLTSVILPKCSLAEPLPPSSACLALFLPPFHHLQKMLLQECETGGLWEAYTGGRSLREVNKKFRLESQWGKQRVRREVEKDIDVCRMRQWKILLDLDTYSVVAHCRSHISTMVPCPCQLLSEMVLVEAEGGLVCTTKTRRGIPEVEQRLHLSLCPKSWTGVAESNQGDVVAKAAVWTEHPILNRGWSRIKLHGDRWPTSETRWPSESRHSYYEIASGRNTQSKAQNVVTPSHKGQRNVL